MSKSPGEPPLMTANSIQSAAVLAQLKWNADNGFVVQASSLRWASPDARRFYRFIRSTSFEVMFTAGLA
jgi:hypothetical protein